MLLQLVLSALVFTPAASAEPVSNVDRLVSRRVQKRADVDTFNLTVFHTNDVHAHLDQYKTSGAICTDPTQGCLAGYARIKAKVDELRPKAGNSLLLDIGDEFQGTLFFSVLGGDPIAETINQMGYDAFVPGNHEFDRGDDYLAAFLSNITFPTVSANIQTNNTKLASLIKPYHIFDDISTAVIGLTTNTTSQISNPDPGTTFLDHVTTMQKYIDEINNTTDVKRIIAMTHIGYQFDQILGQQTRGLYAIIGGHSHTLLGDMEGASGKYPTVVTNLDGDDVFIVQAYRWGEYLGQLTLSFDESGKVLSYEGAPIHLTNATSQNATMEAQIQGWAQSFAPFEAEIVGTSLVAMPITDCQLGECAQGDVLADAMLEFARNQSLSPAFALINAGTIRSGIDAGNVSMGDILTSYPFGNAVTTLQLTGEIMEEVFEGIASKKSGFNAQIVTSFVQVSSNVKFEYNPSNAEGSRLITLEVDGKTLNASQTYTIVTSDYVAGGGDNFVETQSGFEVLDTLDQVFAAYVGAHSPVNVTVGGRIANTTKTTPDDGSGNGNTSRASKWLQRRWQLSRDYPAFAMAMI